MNPKDSSDKTNENVITRRDFFEMAASLHSDKDWSEWSENEKSVYEARCELVRQYCVAGYSTNPSHQARAAKDPEYWARFSIGLFNLPNAMENLLQACLENKTSDGQSASRNTLLMTYFKRQHELPEKLQLPSDGPGWKTFLEQK